MANDDRWRNDQERRYRDQDQGYGGMRGSREQGYGRRSDYQGDGTIAQRGFGNERSGYSRGSDDHSQRYGEPRGRDDNQGSFYRDGREGMSDRYGGGGAYGSDYRGGGMAGGRSGRDFGGGSYGQDRISRSTDQGRSGAYGGNDYSQGFYGADQGHGPEDYERPGYGDWGSPTRRPRDQERGYGRRDNDEPGLLERAGEAIASWFSDDNPRHQQQGRGGDWTGQSHRGRGPKGYARSDSRIQEDVCERLYHDHHVDASEIEISVSNREVTLSGTVDSREARRRAEDIAENVSGVTHVQNNLRVHQHGMPSGLGSNQGVTSGGGMSSSTVAGAMGVTPGTTVQGSTGVEVSRTDGGTNRRKTGTTT